MQGIGFNGRTVALLAVLAAVTLALAWAIEERRIRSFMQRIDEQGASAFEPQHESREEEQ